MARWEAAASHRPRTANVGCPSGPALLPPPPYDRPHHSWSPGPRCTIDTLCRTRGASHRRAGPRCRAPVHPGPCHLLPTLPRLHHPASVPDPSSCNQPTGGGRGEQPNRRRWSAPPVHRGPRHAQLVVTGSRVASLRCWRADLTLRLYWRVRGASLSASLLALTPVLPAAPFARGAGGPAAPRHPGGGGRLCCPLCRSARRSRSWC